MMRLFRFIVLVAAVVALALWMTDRPGTATIEWRDIVVQTTAPFLFLCILALAFVFYLLFRAWHFVRHGPAHWRLRRQMNKMKLGEEQLVRGLVAIASGKAAEAGRLAIAARKNAADGIAAQWLQAQAAQLAGDHRAAHEIFRSLAARDDTAVLGYRGLITAARLAGRWEEVDLLLNELHAKKPETPWLRLMRMESAARKRQWSEAEADLSQAVAARLLDSEEGRRKRAALRIAASRAALVADDADMALRAAEQAVKQRPQWMPAAINLAEVLANAGHTRAATRFIERAWKTTPHPELARILRRTADSPIDAFRLTERLVRGNENTLESRIALAEAALAADVWGEARRNLLALVNERAATAGVFKMLAQAERRERGDERAAAAWLAKAADASPDPVWLCRVCGGAQEDWHPACPACGSFDAFEWQTAGKSRGVSAVKELANYA